MNSFWSMGRRFCAALLVCLSLAVAGCEQQPQESPGLRFAEFKVSFSAPSHLALTTGAITAERLDFTPISVAAGPDVIAALRSSAASGAQAGNLANEPIAAMIGAGGDPVIVATVLTSSEDVQLVTFERNGITEDPRTLRGKTIGLVLDTIGESYLSALLRRGGLTVTDVRLVNARPAELQAALVRGDLDAAILWNPFIAQTPRLYESQRRSGAAPDRGAPRMLLDPTLFTSRMHLVTTRRHLAAQRENLKKLLRALIRTETHILSNRQAAQHSVEDWLGLQRNDLADFFRTGDFRVHLDRAATEAALSEVLGRLRQKQPSTQMPASFDSYIDPSLLREIDRSRIR